MSDLIERLRKRGTYADDGWGSLTTGGRYAGKASTFLTDPLCAEAASEIARLTAENAVLDEAYQRLYRQWESLQAGLNEKWVEIDGPNVRRIAELTAENASMRAENRTLRNIRTRK